MANAQGICAYCGQFGDVVVEHVVPRNIFHPSIRNVCDFVFVDSCDPCNQMFSPHEDSFRNFCTIGSKAGEEARKIYYGPLSSSLDDPRFGRGKLKAIWERMKESKELPGRQKIYPNDGDFFTLRKIVRGLSYAHFPGRIVSDSDVNITNVTNVNFEVPDDWERSDHYHAIHPNVFRYFYDDVTDIADSLSFVCLLEIFGTMQYIGTVNRIES